MKCVICGKEIERSRYFNKVLCSAECHTIDFWNYHLDDDAIIIDGCCYHDGGMKAPGYMGFMGYGGRLFTIQMNDGRIIKTNNLWCNGDVPKERNIKDNAVFITKTRVKKGDLF